MQVADNHRETPNDEKDEQRIYVIGNLFTINFQLSCD